MDRKGKIGVITFFVGPMFSGKSERLITELGLAVIAEQKVLVVKPGTDTRAEGEIFSRHWDPDKKTFVKFSSMPAHVVSKPEDLLALVEKFDPDIIGMDEVQFLKPEFEPIIDELAHDKGIDIFIAGLDLDAWRKKFGPSPQLLAISDIVIKTTAICMKCKRKGARYSQLLVSSKDQIRIGDWGDYEARCRMCHTLPPEA